MGFPKKKKTPENVNIFKVEGILHINDLKKMNDIIFSHTNFKTN